MQRLLSELRRRTTSTTGATGLGQLGRSDQPWEVQYKQHQATELPVLHVGRPVHGLSSQHPFRLPIQSFSPLSRSLFELDLHGLHMLLPCHLFSHPFPLL